jgi:replicative DNA helicase
MSDAKFSKGVNLSKIKRSISSSELEYGKVPPQVKELEEAVLGALMIDNNALSDVIDVLVPDAFYDEAHKTIFKAICDLFDKGKPIDILTVTEQLKKNGELGLSGGPAYITELSNKVASSAHIEYHAHIITQKYIQRELISISSNIIRDAYEDTTDVFDLLDKAEQNLFSITQGNIKRGSEDMAHLVKKAIDQIESLKDREEGIVGIHSGFNELDKVTSGWQPSDLVILAARPGMGKTAFVLSMARNAAVDHNHPVAVFSLEMSSLQLVNRLIASETELPMEKFKRGNLEEHEWIQLTKKVGSLTSAPLFIDDSPALNIFELRAKCRRLKANHDVGLIIIDYLQLMSGTNEGKGGGNREQEISQISRSLKMIAKELNVPVIALSQLSRAVETRSGEKRPMLSDLRESGAIEQDADMVVFIYRPEYYGLTEDADGNPTQGIAEVIIAKHRNGALKTVPLRFIDKFAKFANLDNDEFGDFNIGAESGGDMENQSKFISKISRMDEIDEDMPF